MPAAGSTKRPKQHPTAGPRGTGRYAPAQTDSTLDPRKLLVISFDDPLKANEFLLVAVRLQTQKQIQLHDAVFISRDAEGKSFIRETADITTGQGALGGGMWGLLLGTLLGGPVGGLIAGAATAGGGALLAKIVDTGIKDETLAELREIVSPGSTALALLVSHLSVADLQHELARFPGARLVQSTLPDAAVHAVRAALGESDTATEATPADESGSQGPA